MELASKEVTKCKESTLRVQFLKGLPKWNLEGEAKRGRGMLSCNFSQEVRENQIALHSLEFCPLYQQHSLPPTIVWTTYQRGSLTRGLQITYEDPPSQMFHPRFGGPVAVASSLFVNRARGSFQSEATQMEG